ncbi:Transmembrane 6 super member 1, partial [Gonapodya sp. JEL0774]
MLFPDSDAKGLSSGGTVLPFVAFAIIATAMVGLVVFAVKPFKHPTDDGFQIYMFSFFGFTSIVMGFMPSAAVGIFGEHLAPSFALNIPWVLWPISIVFKLIDERPKEPVTTTLLKPNTKPTFFMIVFLGVLLPFTFIARWIVSAGSTLSWATWYIDHVEPELITPAKFPFIQLTVYALWLAPASIGVARALWVYRSRHLYSSQPFPVWIRDVLFAMFGCLAQGQWCYVGSAYFQTDFVQVEGFRPVPKEHETFFWLLNVGFLVAVPAACCSWAWREEFVGDHPLMPTTTTTEKGATAIPPASSVSRPTATGKAANGHSAPIGELDLKFVDAYIKPSKGFLGHFPGLQALLNAAPSGPHPNPIYEKALKGKRVVVTGASNGIGRDLALLYALHGSHVCVASRDLAGLQKVRSECLAVRAAARDARRKAGGEDVWTGSDDDAVLVVRYDALAEGANERLVGEVVGKWGGLDVLVLNHTMAPFYRLLSAPLDK